MVWPCAYLNFGAFIVQFQIGSFSFTPIHSILISFSLLPMALEMASVARSTNREPAAPVAQPMRARAIAKQCQRACAALRASRADGRLHVSTSYTSTSAIYRRARSLWSKQKLSLFWPYRHTRLPSNL